MTLLKGHLLIFKPGFCYLFSLQLSRLQFLHQRAPEMISLSFYNQFNPYFRFWECIPNLREHLC